MKDLFMQDKYLCWKWLVLCNLYFDTPKNLSTASEGRTQDLVFRKSVLSTELSDISYDDSVVILIATLTINPYLHDRQQFCNSKVGFI